MRLNDDLSTPIVMHAGQIDWVASPAKGVDRRMLFRIGEEKARATSIVRYAPGSHFARHSHPGGEEFLVLDGIFQDETGDFPAGSYVRNPPTSGHAPGSETGCIIFVKLWQFRSDDRHKVLRRPDEAGAMLPRPGVHSSRLLFEGVDERVMLESWAAGAAIDLANANGLELLVIDGGFTHGSDILERWSWLRLPAGVPFHAHIGENGAALLDCDRVVDGYSRCLKVTIERLVGAFCGTELPPDSRVG